MQYKLQFQVHCGAYLWSWLGYLSFGRGSIMTLGHANESQGILSHHQTWEPDIQNSSVASKYTEYCLGGLGAEAVVR